MTVSQRKAAHLLRVTVEEQVGHDVPRNVAEDRSSQSEDLTRQHPPHQTNRVVVLATQQVKH